MCECDVTDFLPRRAHLVLDGDDARLVVHLDLHGAVVEVGGQHLQQVHPGRNVAEDERAVPSGQAGVLPAVQNNLWFFRRTVRLAAFVCVGSAAELGRGCLLCLGSPASVQGSRPWVSKHYVQR